MKTITMRMRSGGETSTLGKAGSTSEGPSERCLHFTGNCRNKYESRQHIMRPEINIVGKGNQKGIDKLAHAVMTQKRERHSEKIVRQGVLGDDTRQSRGNPVGNYKVFRFHSK